LRRCSLKERKVEIEAISGFRFPLVFIKVFFKDNYEDYFNSSVCCEKTFFKHKHAFNDVIRFYMLFSVLNEDKGKHNL
jgi:hypothetical protein